MKPIQFKLTTHRVMFVLLKLNHHTSRKQDTDPYSAGPPGLTEHTSTCAALHALSLFKRL